MKPGRRQLLPGRLGHHKGEALHRGPPQQPDPPDRQPGPGPHTQFPLQRGLLRLLGPSRTSGGMTVMAPDSQPATPHHAMVIDTSRCIGCWACAVGCKQINNEPLGFWWNRVLTTAPNQSTALKEPASENIDVPWGVFPDVELAYLPVACQHCNDAPCVKVLPGTGDLPPRRRHRPGRLRALHRLPVLHGGLPLRGAHLQLGRRRVRTGRRGRLRQGLRDRGPPRVRTRAPQGRGREVHFLRRAHRRGPGALLRRGVPHGRPRCSGTSTTPTARSASSSTRAAGPSCTPSSAPARTSTTCPSASAWRARAEEVSE